MAKSPGVFIVDQDPDVRFHVQRLVSQAGFTPAGHAGLGTEAVAQASELRPDIVVCGLKEPLERVVQTLESLAHALSAAPIIVYSSSNELSVIRRAMLAGARDFLRAPFGPDDLKRSLTAALESEERRRLREAGGGALGPQGLVITVFGAKGGVGKTTVSTNLAVALARRADQTTVLVDADDTFGDAAAALALTPERSVTDCARELHASDNESMKRFLTLHESGLAVLATPAAPFDWKGIAAERVSLMIQRLARQFDVVLADTASTLSDVSQAVLESASLILWVTTPEYASVRDSLQAMQAIRTLGLPEERIRMVLNVAAPEVEVRPQAIEEALGRPIFWTIPYDRQLRRSSQMGQALVQTQPLSPAAANLTELALTLTGSRPAPHADGLLSRMFTKRNGNGWKHGRLKVNEVQP